MEQRPVIERFATVTLVAGVGFFGLSVLLFAWLPFQLTRQVPMVTVEEIAKQPIPEFYDLARRYPEQFMKYFGEPNSESYARALRMGRDIYIAEACWHCHSQFVRPVSNEDIRFGRVSYAAEHQNELQLPQLLGTRRVGPDLIRSAGKHGNDWHAAHFYEPRWVVPTSVMPSYKWFFDPPAKPGDPPQPNARGLAIITYVQWLGSWAEPLPPPILPAQAAQP
ncbi:MAG: cbb3-type cytochrome c oxidase subunit II [Verrucomicrobiae bacterium]|nr:cbb3-type cytochrome c oxidase subunit II [Verrucomicrobiae bacterium]